MTTATPFSEQRTAKSGLGIGPIGTAARVAAGLGLLYLGWWYYGVQWHAVALGLVGFPAILMLWQRLRLLRTSTPLRATGLVGYLLNFGIGLALFTMPFTDGAAALFYGTSMLLAAARGYGGCEILAVSNWLLRRDDQVGCVVFSPVDALEAQLNRQQQQKC